METSELLLLCYLRVSILILDAQSFYQWSCSPLDDNNNRYFLPDLPITDHEAAASVGEVFYISDENVVYIFPVPSMLDCGGTVVGLRYCYAHFDDETFEFDDELLDIFTLLILEQGIGPRFKVIDTYTVRSTPNPQICTQRLFGEDFFVRYCCETSQLDKFRLPDNNFAFGMAEAMPLLRYVFNEDFLVEHYRFRANLLPPPVVGTVYPRGLVGDITVNETLRIFQFFIGNFISFMFSLYTCNVL